MHAKNIATCLFPTFFSDIFGGPFTAESFTTDSGIYIDILVILIGKKTTLGTKVSKLDLVFMN